MAHLGFEVVAVARRWAQARAKLRRLLDSKSATPDAVEAAKKGYTKRSDELEVVVSRVEAMAKAGVLKKRASKPIDWRSVLGAVNAVGAIGAAALESAVAPDKSALGEDEIIDAEFEVLNERKK